MADQISICNMALAEIVAEPIESLQERSLGARECDRYFSQSLNALLESHDWGFATVRAVLPPAVNPRPQEWVGAFALPVDVARPIAVLQQAVAVSWPYWWLHDRAPRLPYIIEQNLLYAGCSDATLAYVSNGVKADAFPAKFVDALVLQLASRIVTPIKKSREMKSDLIKQAEVAKQRAMADDINRQPAAGAPLSQTWVDQVDRVRNGWEWER